MSLVKGETMEGPRAPLQNEFKQLIHFLDSELRPESKWSLTSEYPTAIHPQNIHNMRIITEESTVLSHAVIKPLILKTPYAVFKGETGLVLSEEQLVQCASALNGYLNFGKQGH